LPHHRHWLENAAAAFQKAASVADSATLHSAMKTACTEKIRNADFISHVRQVER
jgi:hypothetical protein